MNINEANKCKELSPEIKFYTLKLHDQNSRILSLLTNLLMFDHSKGIFKQGQKNKPIPWWIIILICESYSLYINQDEKIKNIIKFGDLLLVNNGI